MSTRPSLTPSKSGRPAGKKNASTLDRVRRDRDRIIRAQHKRALQGDSQAAQVCLDLLTKEEAS